MNKQIKTERYERRKMRVRSKIVGTASRPRLSVFRSNQHIYVQLIDDENAQTLLASSDVVKNLEGRDAGKMKKLELAALVGEDLAKKALSKKIKTVIFDRNGFMYHGRVKALAEGARKGGLEF